MNSALHATCRRSHLVTLPLCSVAVLALLFALGALAQGAELTPQQREFFEARVRPLLVERCHKCHGPDEQEAGLRLDSRSAILKGGDTGPAAVPGRPDDSELVRAIRYDPDGYQMPPDGKLSDAQIAVLTEWVEMGAPWPDDGTAVADSGEEFNLEERARRWSFQPLTKPPVPPVVSDGDEAPSQRSTDSGRGIFTDWCRNPIDRFILAKLREHGLSPAPPTDRSTLLRRAAFDVVGLPPSPQQVEAFLADTAADAYARRVDELLASPHFGERWGRHWLDLVRYAEGRGHEFDFDVAGAHQYRDYVIRALNDDVPYDQFVVEHVAGDLLTASEECLASGGRWSTDDGQPAEERVSGLTPTARHLLRLHPRTGANESILGTGFWHLGEWIHSPVDIRADEAERFSNMIDVYSKTFLGLTVACARCHDHKFDPITTKDFYALQGYLQSSHYRQARFETMEHNREIAEKSKRMEREAMYAILPVYMRVLERSVDRLDGYLIAALELFRTHGVLRTENAVALTDDELKSLVSTIAMNRGLEPQILTAWIRHLLTEAADEIDPFHIWSLVCNGPLDDLAAFNQYARRQRRAADARDRSYADADAQFAENAIGVWDIECGAYLFCDNQLTLTDDPGQPYADFDSALVRFNPLFSNLELAPHSDVEPGAIGKRRTWESAVHTATFEIERDRLFLDVRGNCSVYVGVDSHILIKGPLHASLFGHHAAPEGSKNQRRWLEIDVSRYKGHRAHVEVHPDGPATFTLDAIWQSDVAPADSRGRTPDMPAGRGTGGRFESFDELAQAFVGLFGSTGCLESAFIPPPDTASTGTCIHDYGWAIEHPQLFGLDLPDVTSELAAVAEPYIHRKRHLKTQVRNMSATAPAMARGSGEREPVFIRGNWRKPGELAPRQFLEVFDGGQVPGDDRLALAEWMVEPDKTPILPRVIVNRIWKHYFGVGIVPTPDDFGYMGQDPSHPELLDWLASELVAHDWSLKHIHRLILTSAAYRMRSESVVRGPSSVEASDDDQSSPRTTDHEPRTAAHSTEVDPDNRLLHRMNVKRLEGEVIRDAVLSLSGRLDEQMYGRSIPVHLTPFMEGRGRPAQTGPVDGAGRRSLYIAVRRNFPDPFFQAFDMPNPHTTAGRRNVSNVPAQALAMLNNPFVAQQAQLWGQRLLADHSQASPAGRIRAAYVACMARQPLSEEIDAALEFVQSHSQQLECESDDPRVWGDLCHVLLNSKEFAFVR